MPTSAKRYHKANTSKDYENMKKETVNRNNWQKRMS